MVALTFSGQVNRNGRFFIVPKGSIDPIKTEDLPKGRKTTCPTAGDFVHDKEGKGFYKIIMVTRKKIEVIPDLPTIPNRKKICNWFKNSTVQISSKLVFCSTGRLNFHQNRAKGRRFPRETY